MATAMVAAFGRYVAVGRMACGAEGVCCVNPGLGTKTSALLNGVGVAAPVLVAQLENSSAHRSRMKIY